MTSKITRILSGITTSGVLHLGNYLGAMKNWQKLVAQHQTFLFLADLHAITTDQEPKNLHDNTLKMLALYLACGLDVENSTIFIQSQIKQHAELAWILSCTARMGWLNRMTQFKDKSGKNKDNAYVGLFTYPILMAADILLYSPSHVPVGDDQKQHLELARDIAISFNNHYQAEIFSVPEPLIEGTATRVMSLRDASQKMSKSSAIDMSRINLLDDEELIIKKIKKAKTDSEVIKPESLEERLELKNLLNIYAALTDQNPRNIINQYSGQGFAKFKLDLASIIVEVLKPIKEKYDLLIKNKAEIIKIAHNNAIIASETAEEKLQQVKSAVGFVT